MQQVPWLKHHPQLRGCELRPHLIRDAGGLLSPFHMEGGQQGQEHWESTPRHPIHPPTPPPRPPNCCPHPHHPLPAPPHALNTFLRCSSCFPPIPGGRFFQHGHSPLLPKKGTWRGSNNRKSLQCPRVGCKSPLPHGTHGARDHSHSSSAAGTSVCRLCPAGWQPFAAKCYWVSMKTGVWEVAAENCSYQRSQLVTLKSVEEKVTNCGGKAQALPRLWLF